MQYVLTPQDFLTGLALSQNKGGLWLDMRGIDFYVRGTYLNGVGSIKPFYPPTDLGTINAKIKRWAKYSTGTASLNQYNFGIGNGYAYRIKYPVQFTELETESGADKGIAKCEISGTDYMYVATSTKLARITNLTGTMTWDNNSGSYYGTFNNSGNHPAHTMYDITWWGDGNQVAKLESDGTFTANALDLPDDYTIVSISEWDIYLAILAVRGKSYFTQESRIFFWDMSSPTWNFDRIIPKVVQKILNHGGILYALSIYDDFTLYYFTGSVFEKLYYSKGRNFSISSAYFDIDLFDLYDDTIYFVGRLIKTDNGTVTEEAIDVYSWGNNFNNLKIPKVINKPALVFTADSEVSSSIGGLTVGWNGTIIVSYNDGTNDKLVGFYTGDQAGAYAITRDLDSYFIGKIAGAGLGMKKNINWIRVDFEPLTSGDKATLQFAKDYSTTYNNICKTAAGSAIDYSADGAVASKTFNSNFKIGTFRQLNLKIYFNSGEVKIHRIIIDWNYADSTGR